MRATQGGPATSHYAIGLDVGGTKIAGGLVDLATGTVSERRLVPTEPERGGEAVLATTTALAADLLAAAARRGLEPLGIGLGVCELVDRAGAITSGHTVAWAGLPVKQRLGELAPTVVEADVRAAARAEARYGAGREHDPFVYVTVGTGISSCLVQGGVPFAGARGNALVLATAPITLPCPECGATRSMAIEEIAAGPALVARYNARAGADLCRAEEVAAAAAAGDAIALDVVESAASALGMGVGWLVNVLDPAALVVGGGLGLAGGQYWSCFVQSTRLQIWAESSRGLPILLAHLGGDAGTIGAAAGVAAGSGVG